MLVHSARIMVNTKTMSDVLQYFRHYTRKLEAKARCGVLPRRALAWLTRNAGSRG